MERMHFICKQVIEKCSKDGDTERNRAKIRCLAAVVKTENVDLQKYSDDAFTKIDFDQFESFFSAKTYIKLVKALDDCKEFEEAIKQMCKEGTTEIVRELAMSALALAEGLEKPISDQLENFELRLSEFGHM